MKKMTWDKWFALSMLVGFFVICLTAFSWGAEKFAIVVGDTTAVGADTLIHHFIRDSITSPGETAVTVEYFDDIQAKNFTQTQWDSSGVTCIIWLSSAFAYDISSITLPIFTDRTGMPAILGLGTKDSTSSATQRWQTNHNHWITNRILGDTIFPIHGANLSGKTVLGVNGGDLQSLIKHFDAGGNDTSMYVVVDSGALLQDGIATAPNRRIFSAFTNPNIWTWAHGWHELFMRSMYYLINDTINPRVRNVVYVDDKLTQTTWTEIGSCNMATTNRSTVRVGEDNSNRVHSYIRYDSLVQYVGSAPTGSSIVIDSAIYMEHTPTSTPWNIQGADSAFHFRVQPARIRRQVKFNQGTSNYNGSTCGVNDTANTTNHWVNRFTPAYPSTSRHLWASTFGDLVTDSAWKADGGTDITLDIFPPNKADTVEIDSSVARANTWTRFPLESSWFQAWVDTPSTNYGFALHTDTSYNPTADIEVNYTAPSVPNSDFGPRLIIYWSYTANAPAASGTKHIPGIRR